MMRCLVLILPLLGAPALADDVVLHEQRVWKGVVDVTSKSREPTVGEGCEQQRERIEFVLLTQPPRMSVMAARLPMKMRESSGSWELSVDRTEGEGLKAVKKKGWGEGRLHPRVIGYIEPTTGRYRLRLACEPKQLVAKTSMAGLVRGQPATWRSVTARRPFLSTFDVGGELTEEGRVLAGEQSFIDKRVGLARKVEIRWRVERVDPVVAGCVFDHLDRPVVGLKVVAHTTNPNRMRRRLPPIVREGTTDAEGRFRIGVYWAHWSVAIAGAVRDGVVFTGHQVKGGTYVRFDDVESLDVRVKAYNLRALPRSRLLAGHFQGNVLEYLAYIEERASKRRLDAALVAPPAER